MKIQVKGYARIAISILKNRIHDDGADGISAFSATHERDLCRAVRDLIKIGVLSRVDAPRGEIRVKAGPNFFEIR